MDSSIFYDTSRLLTSLLGLTFLCAFCSVITSFVTAPFANVGFTNMLTCLSYMLFSLGGIYTLTSSRNPLSLGFLMGVSVCMVLTSFNTAVYWGQLHGCKDTLDGYGDNSIFIGTNVSNPDNDIKVSDDCFRCGI